jgi:UDP-GlcNAc:undecaprenyl-phosphate GlcNAc-1-phosphate transferase
MIPLLPLAAAAIGQFQPKLSDQVEAVRKDIEGATGRVQSISDAVGFTDGGLSKDQIFESLGPSVDQLNTAIGRAASGGGGRIDVFHGYVAVFVVSFVVALIATPLMRRLAVANGVIDRPSESRKIHRIPVAYLGGAAVFLGLIAGIFYSYIASALGPDGGLLTFHKTRFVDEAGAPYPVPLSVLLGMTVIMLVGLLDDVIKISPRVKLGGQLFAAAALAADDVGVRVAQGILGPIGHSLFGNAEMIFNIPLPVPIPGLGDAIHFNAIYWAGTAIIAVFVLGACNASNLIDGLDGLLSGTTAIASIGLLVIALTLAVNDQGPRDASRVILCMALLGACLGFLPHNFNPATIFLGDAGSLLLGFSTIVIILTLGDQGQTHLVTAGLIIYAIPIIDTVLAIVRRKMAGKRISDPDDQHLHHMLKRALGVKGAVFVLYGIGIGFAALGVALSMGRARLVYAITLVFASFIVVTAIKIARKRQIESQAHQGADRRPRTATLKPVPKGDPETLPPAAAAVAPSLESQIRTPEPAGR